MSERIGIVGSGPVGKALGRGFTARGHEVVIGSREPERADLVRWREEVGTAGCTFSDAEAARFGEIVVFAVSWEGLESAIRLAGEENLRGKIVIDCTNPLRHHGAGMDLALGWNDSAGELVQRLLPDARVVKTFNHTGSAVMVDPDLPCAPPTMFLCGDDAGAKERVAGLLHDFGWESLDVGGIQRSRLLEPLGMLWILYGQASGRWDHAYKVLRPEA
ncbi:MAG: NADPH-dependent F420 reductase [Coriobacteriia bacterium]|nr:NADPH-dependent F420 reductase [Coriobacteriia bacterium]